MALSDTCPKIQSPRDIGNHAPMLKNSIHIWKLSFFHRMPANGDGTIYRAVDLVTFILKKKLIH